MTFLPIDEGDWKYDGPLSHFGEYDSAVVGIGIGVFFSYSNKANKLVKKEPHYIIAFAILTYGVIRNYGNG